METLVKRKPELPKKDSAGLRFLYGNVAGRCILRIIRAKWISVIAGAFLNTRFSKLLIASFIKKGNIDINDYECDDIKSFNDFFSRRIKAGKRPIAQEKDALISPCDSFVSVYKITSGKVYPVKQSEYTLTSLLKNDALTDEFENGYMFVFRLCVEHYHRYCYPANGQKGKNIHIKGTLHTVRPVALYNRRVFCENSREYTVIDTEQFGKMIQMEVGALLVGKIKNFHGEKSVKKGEEKGTFLYGGSTVILICKDGYVTPAPDLLENTESGMETSVKQGEQINI